MAYRGRVQEFDRFLCNSIGILKWNQRAPTVVQQFDRVPIWSRNDGLARSQGKSKRSGNHLRLMPVGSNVNVCSANKLDHFFRTDKPVVKNDLRFHSHFLGQRLQIRSILITLATKNVRMRGARDQVDDILVLGQNLRQRLYDVLDPLVRREQTEGQQNCLPFDAESVLKEIGIEERQIRHSMRNRVDLAARNPKNFLQNLG